MVSDIVPSRVRVRLLLLLLGSEVPVANSHPPPHAGCPRGDPGPLPVLTRIHYRITNVVMICRNTSEFDSSPG